MSIFSRFGMSFPEDEALGQPTIRALLAGRVLDFGTEVFSSSTAPDALNSRLGEAIGSRFAVHTDRATSGTGLNAFDSGRPGTDRFEPLRTDLPRFDNARLEIGRFDTGLARAPAMNSFLETQAAQLPVKSLAPSLPTDPLFTQQYYIRNTAAGERDLALFRGDTSVWDEFNGTGVKVGIIDDGIDSAHPDLNGNYVASRHAVVGGVTISGEHPSASDAHGTAVAGIIAAERDGVGTVGIAYNATITMMPAISGSAPLTTGQAMGNWRQFDVINNSWGFTQIFADSAFNAGVSIEHAELFDMAAYGRNGLGTIWVKSAGNGRDDFDNSNGSWLNGHWASIAVAAVTRDGFVTEYSTEGAANFISAFGGPIPGDIVTTDRRGTAGYNTSGGAAGNYTTSFNGTSSAGPEITGIVALMLDANPNLGFRDVQSILAATARHTGSAFGAGPSGFEIYDWEWNGATTWNGGGMHFSEDYGFGLADALAAVRLAESWKQQNTFQNMQTIYAASISLPYNGLAINDNSQIQVTFNVTNNVEIERVILNLGISHLFSGDLQIRLISPDGTVSQLWENNGSVAIPNYGAYDIALASNMFRGEDAVGTWTLQIEDTAAGDTGALFRARLELIGAAPSPDDTYIFTEEYSDFQAGRTDIEDTNGGTDTINASAVFSNSVIRLSAGVNNRIDGVTFQTDGNFENFVGGDGADNIQGNNSANVLEGWRGNDVILGLNGNDTLIGGKGNDTMTGGAGSDRLDLSEGNDRAVFNAISESTGTGRDTIVGMDLNADKFDVVNLPTVFVVDNSGSLNAASFDTAIGNNVNGVFNPNGAIEAVLFDPNGGDLNIAGHKFLIIDSNNSGTYESGSDLVIELIDSTGALHPSDFV